MSLILTYLEYTKTYLEEYGDKTVVLMMVGSFYEIYGVKSGEGINKTITGSKIEDIAKICDLAIAQKTEEYVMAGFTHTKIDKYLRKIQGAGYTSIVIKQDPTNPKIRTIEGIYSPGTFFNAESSEISNNTMCIWIERVTYSKSSSIIIGIANVDIYTGRVTIFEHTVEDKHNPTTYDELERYISTYKPSEIILITNFSEKITEDIINFTGIGTITCKNVHKVCLSNDISMTELPNQNKFIEKAKRCEKQTYRDEVLRKFYAHNVAESFIGSTFNYEYATQALTFLLNFLNEHNPHLVNKIREPVFDNKSDRVILANHSLKQLNIIDDDNYTGKYSSVLRFLNNCITPMGMRKFKYKILNPIFNVEKLNKEYDITDYMISLGEAQISEWRKSLAELKDIEKLHRQIIHQKVNPRNVYFLYNNLDIISTIYDKIKSDKMIVSYIVQGKSDGGSDGGDDISTICKKIRNFMESNFDMIKCASIDNINFDENFILENVSNKLDKIVYNYENSFIELKTIQTYFDGLIAMSEKESKSEKKYEYVKIHETEKMGYTLISTKRRVGLLEEQIKKQSKIQSKTMPSSIQGAGGAGGAGGPAGSASPVEYMSYNKVKNILHIELSGVSFPASTGNNCSIHSNQISKICDTIIKSKMEMKQEIENVFTNFIKNIQNMFEKDIREIIDTVTMIDILQNKVYVAQKYKYCKPVIKNLFSSAEASSMASAASYPSSSSSSFIKAEGMRHCLIEHINMNETYVTNDIELGAGTTQNGILLYGTNAVGKTSLIRAIGISVIMAQSGLYVPCSSFEYIPYKSIFTRILGNDNLFKGMSTFMVEMSELRVILKSATNTGLILGDELCSGTEIDSAISIFVAGLKKMHDSKCSFIFATHMHEINKYEEVISMDKLSMKHLEVIYNKEMDSLVYDRKLKDGPGFSMYGLEVCKSLHLPEDFLEYANEIRLKYRNSEQSILSSDKSRYNSKKIRNMCEFCSKEIATEVHHLRHQKYADGNNFIDHFSKNHVANLASICEKCHDLIHANEEQHKKVLTSRGSIIIKM
jgi:DNA mismatch repair protein MutS